MAKHENLGAAEPVSFSSYTGHHREFSMDRGYGYYPLGDRNRGRQIYVEFIPVGEENTSDPAIRNI